MAAETGALAPKEHKADSLPHNAFRTLLEMTPVSALVRDDVQVVTVDSAEKPETAFQRIVENKILSAPVYDSKSNRYIGFLETRDLVSFVVFQHEEHEREKQQLDKAHLVVPPHDLRSLFDVAAKFYQRPLDGITTSYLCKRNKFYPVFQDDNLLKVAELLSRSDCHRVPVLGSDEKTLLDVISQSTLIKFLFDHKDEFKAELGRTIADTKLGSRPVIPVKSDDTALYTFKQMSKYNRSGLAVVDETGRLIGNTSASDLKLFIRNPEVNAKLLSSPIIEFLNIIRQEDVTTTKMPTITVRETDTVERVLGKLHATKVHRVFVADDAHGFKPDAVISLTDLLRFILHVDVQEPHVHVESS